MADEYIFISNSALRDAPDAKGDPAALLFSLDDDAGILIASNELTRFLDRHQLRSRGKPTATEVAGVYRITLGTELAMATIQHWDGKNANAFRDQAQVFASAISRDVTLSVPHCRKHPPAAATDPFTILIWSGPPESSNSVAPPERCRGIPLSCRDTAFSPSGNGLPIVDAETGYVMAELFTNTLYIFHDICDVGTQEELELFEVILHEVAELLQLRADQLASRYEQIKVEAAEREATKQAQQRELVRNKYVALCQQRLVIDERTAAEQLSQATTTIAKLQRELILAIRQEADAQEYLHDLHSSEGKTKHYGDEFDRLTTLDSVREVTVSGSTLEVLTDTIYCTNPGTKQVHEIGRFKITIDTGGQNDMPLTINNLDRQLHHPTIGMVMQAPHVSSSGVPCLGNLKEIIPKLIGQHQYPALLIMIIGFLQSADTNDSWGQSLIVFPLRR